MRERLGDLIFVPQESAVYVGRQITWTSNEGSQVCMRSVHGRGVRIELHTGQTSESLLAGFRLAERDCQNPAGGCSISVPPEFLKVVEAGSAMPVNSSERQFVVFHRIALSVASQPGCLLLVF